MIQSPALPAWAALIVALLVVAGAVMTLIGSLGLLRLRTFYDRVHPPTLGSSLGMTFVILASIICFSVLQSRPSVHEMLAGFFMTVTTPVTFMLLARAALYRDRAEGRLEHWPEMQGREDRSAMRRSHSGETTARNI